MSARLAAWVAFGVLTMVPISSRATVACLGWSHEVRKPSKTLLAGVLGIPAYLAHDARMRLGSGLNPIPPTERDPPSANASPRTVGMALDGSISGTWGDDQRLGYRIDWYDLQWNHSPCGEQATNIAMSFAASTLQTERSELQTSFGFGTRYTILPVPLSLHLGAMYQYRITESLLVSTRAQFIPILTGGEPGFGGRIQTRLQWTIVPGFQPYLQGATGTECVGVSPVYASGILGFEARWGRDNRTH